MQNSQVQTIKITAVIPAYNAERYIGRAIESVLAQTRPVDEIIVVDDGSTDNTAGVVRAFGDKVKLICQPNAGECAARNTGIKAAVSSWIAFLDADDEWLPDKIQMQTEVITQTPSLGWVSSNYIRCLCDEGIQNAHIASAKIKRLLTNKAYFADFFEAFRADSYGCSDTILVKKDILVKAGMFREGQQKAGDMDMWWRIAFRHPQFGYVNKPLAIYHLDIPGCASVVFDNWYIYREMVHRNLEIAEQLGRLDAFSPAAAYMLKRWMRSMLFDRQADEIRKILSRFDFLFSPAYKWMMRLLISQPTMTARALRWISRLVRFLKLRRQLTRKPQKLNEQ
jgi:glycosyltransferase involved in cell wall biosynthesis